MSKYLRSVESSDDDKIVSYKWEETKGPISSHGKLESVGAHKPILQLKNLEAGKYTFRYEHCFNSQINIVTNQIQRSPYAQVISNSSGLWSSPSDALVSKDGWYIAHSIFRFSKNFRSYLSKVLKLCFTNVKSSNHTFKKFQ